MTGSSLLRRVRGNALPPLKKPGLDAATLDICRKIVDDVRARGEIALREHAEGLGDVQPGHRS